MRLLSSDPPSVLLLAPYRKPLFLFPFHSLSLFSLSHFLSVSLSLSYSPTHTLIPKIKRMFAKGLLSAKSPCRLFFSFFFLLFSSLQSGSHSSESSSLFHSIHVFLLLSHLLDPIFHPLLQSFPAQRYRKGMHSVSLSHAEVLCARLIQLQHEALA